METDPLEIEDSQSGYLEIENVHQHFASVYDKAHILIYIYHQILHIRLSISLSLSQTSLTISMRNSVLFIVLQFFSILHNSHAQPQSSLSKEFTQRAKHHEQNPSLSHKMIPFLAVSTLSVHLHSHSPFGSPIQLTKP
jgi:hypothetical protein